jgi:hypothetical protein
MNIFISVNQENRVTGWGDDTGIQVKVTDPNFIYQPYLYRYEDGQLVKDTVFQEQLVEERKARQKQPTLTQEMADLKKQNADLAFELMMKGVL